MDKPNGLYVIEPAHGLDFVAGLPIGKFHGIGPATEAKMQKLGINTGADLREKTLVELVDRFGKSGQYYYNIARAIDERPVRSKRVRKSLGKETTFAEDVMSLDMITEKLNSLAELVLGKLAEQALQAKTITLKIKYANFQQVTRSQSVEAVLDMAAIKRWIPQLLKRTEAGKKPVRLVGLSLSGLEKIDAESRGQQLELV
jgi:DNA polymerase-4